MEYITDPIEIGATRVIYTPYHNGLSRFVGAAFFHPTACGEYKVFNVHASYAGKPIDGLTDQELIEGAMEGLIDLYKLCATEQGLKPREVTRI